jgi:hypothetical protein
MVGALPACVATKFSLLVVAYRYDVEVAERKALVTTSCPHALKICALLLDIPADDKVIVPLLAFVSAANGFALRGAHRPCLAS